jgi:hypothetical protein
MSGVLNQRLYPASRGLATPIRGKSSTRRKVPVNMTVYDPGGSQTPIEEKGLAPASQRLAAHQRGRAIGPMNQVVLNSEKTKTRCPFLIYLS